VNCAAGTIPSLIVTMTFRPTVQAPANAKTENSNAAVAFRTSLPPTAGPTATPVDDPPMLNPTNTATTRPTASSSDTIRSSGASHQGVK